MVGDDATRKPGKPSGNGGPTRIRLRNVGRSIAAPAACASEQTRMNQSAVTTAPVSDGVRQALEISLRGAHELVPKEEGVKKLGRRGATGQPLGTKRGLDPPAPEIPTGTRWCSTNCG